MEAPGLKISLIGEVNESWRALHNGKTSKSAQSNPRMSHTVLPMEDKARIPIAQIYLRFVVTL